jgi:sulfatase maturation enzyme AslB (radical SAM superfamily)
MKIFSQIDNKLARSIAGLAAKYYLGKPDVSELLQIKMPTISSVINAGINELFFRLGLERGYKLTTVNIEVTNHCNIKCKMCPVSGKMQRQKGFMGFSLFKKIIDDNPQIEFILPFQWGEPFLHKDIFEMVKYAASKGIRVMLTSNGTLLDEQTCHKIIDSGLLRITFSVDGVGDTYTGIRGVSYSALKNNILMLKKIRDERKSNLKIDISMVVFKDTEQEVEKLFSEWKPLVDRVQVIPVFTQMERKTSCRELWRGMAVVLWDGRVTVCCADYDGGMAYGDANKESLAAIWNGQRMRKLRREHRQGKFSGTCKNCGEYGSLKVSKRFQ